MDRQRLAAAFVITLLTAATAWAQDARTTLERHTRPGDVLTIDVRNLGPVEGRLVRLERDEVHIEFGSSTRPVAYGDIDRVRRRRNGAGMGTAIGAGTGLVYGTIGAIIGAQTEDIGFGGGLFVVAAFTATGAAVGWAIDKALSLNRTVYRRAATTVGIDLAPRPGGAAIGITARW
jgi:hypothetical protein